MKIECMKNIMFFLQIVILFSCSSRYSDKNNFSEHINSKNNNNYSSQQNIDSTIIKSQASKNEFETLKVDTPILNSEVDNTISYTHDSTHLSNNTNRYPSYSDPSFELEKLKMKYGELQRSIESEKFLNFQIEAKANAEEYLRKISAKSIDQLIEENSRKLLNPPLPSTYYTPTYSATNPEIINVEGYNRANGKYVETHIRTAPNATTSDNFSTYPNINPNTGKVGSKRN